MQTSSNLSSHKTEQLADAFRIFNELSENLADSYQSLEKQVEKLRTELVQARSDRLKTLIENEKIADRLQQILAALPAGIIVLDSTGRIVDFNAVALSFLGEPLLGRTWNEILNQRLLALFDNPHELQLPDGKRVSLSQSPLKNNSGHLVLLSDVTEMRGLQDTVNQQKHLSAMGEMVARMAHQLRTPLSTAVLYASHLTKPALDETKRQRFSNTLVERLHYLDRQISDMLMYAKEGRLTMETFSLSNFLAQIEETLREKAISSGIRFTLTHQVDVENIKGNEDALRGAVVNLLNNAIEVCGSEGNISLDVSMKDTDLVCFTVTDDGAGMTEEHRKRVFEPFYTTKISGTGLGLAVVETVAKAHGGSVSCHSVQGEGSCFAFSIPVYAERWSILPSGFFEAEVQSGECV
jgi:two-component system, sensor histidine kinase FlrB